MHAALSKKYKQEIGNFKEWAWTYSELDSGKLFKT
jgi:hypothetical protein